MTRLLHTFILLGLLPVFQTDDFSPRTLLKPRDAGFLTIPVNLDSRTSFEMLAERAGLNIVFYPGFEASTRVPLKIEKVDIVGALDSLSQQTGNFWFPFDSKTIVVAPDTPPVRRAIEPQILKTIYLPKEIGERNTLGILNELRTRLQLRNVFGGQAANVIVMREQPSQLALAEKMISEMTGAAPLSSSVPVRLAEGSKDRLLLLQNGTIRSVVSPSRSSLQSVLKGAVSINMNEPARAMYEVLGEKAGLNVIFDPQLPAEGASRFHVEGVDFIDAMDLLALHTGTFWQPLNDKTIQVMRDTPTNRRRYETMVVKVIYLSNGVTQTDLNGILNTIRITIAARNVFQSEKAKAIVVRDTPNGVFLVEKLIADLDRETRPPSVTVKTSTGSLLAESGWVLGTAMTARPQLELKLRNRTNIRLNATSRASYESLGEMAGLKVVFDSRFTDRPAVPFHLNGVDILEALDLLSWQTGNFWQVVDSTTIRVAADTQASRRELEPVLSKAITPTDSTPTALNGALNILRTVLSLRQVSLVEEKSILVQDTADNIALAEQLVAALERPGAKP